MKRIEAHIFSSLFLLAVALPVELSALDSPNQIGYYCNPQTTSIVEGQYYTLQSDPCTYLSPTLSFGPRAGHLYRGTIGNATAISGHNLGLGPSSAQSGDASKDEAFNIQQGEDMFVAIWRDFNGLQSGQFDTYFRTGAGAPPHQDYGFIRFKYGVEPPPEPDPVIIIPGILGSEQHNGEWIIDPILHTYDDLIATLDANGYTPDVDLFPFPYNWRKSNVETALLLKDKINEVKNICQCDKVDLVAHSMGGLAARQYIQSDAYEQDVDQLIFLGTPHLGSLDAYLMWEAGEVGPFGSFRDAVMERILKQEAEEKGYTDVFSYIHVTPIPSIGELLPVYSYIFDDSLLRSYPENYPANSFLENLNANVAILTNSGVRINNIVGSIIEQNTVTGIQATDPAEFLPKWPNGYPKNYDDRLGDHGLLRGSGDGTVPLPSSSFVNSNLLVSTSTHRSIPSEQEGKIFEILTGNLADTLVHNNQTDFKLLLIKILSPADLFVLAPDGSKIGKENGQEVNEIPGAFYTGFNTDTEFITILNPLDGEYKVFTEGTGNGAYTVETNYISDATTTEASFTGNTAFGLITELDVTVDNQNPQPDIQPSDILPPVISILAPETRDYLRSEQLPVDVSAVDGDSGLQSLETRFDGTLIPNVSSVDLFFNSLGNHTLSASSTDNVNNETTVSRTFRVIANATSTRSDMQRVFTLAWMTQKVYDDLLKKFTACFKEKKTITNVTKTVVVAGKNGKPPTTKTIQEKVTKVEIYFDKKVAQDMLKTLDKYRGKGLNEQGYQLLNEDIQWLISNLL